MSSLRLIFAISIFSIASSVAGEPLDDAKQRLGSALRERSAREPVQEPIIAQMERVDRYFGWHSMHRFASCEVRHGLGLSEHRGIRGRIKKSKNPASPTSKPMIYRNVSEGKSKPSSEDFQRSANA